MTHDEYIDQQISIANDRLQECETVGQGESNALDIAVLSVARNLMPWLLARIEALTKDVAYQKQTAELTYKALQKKEIEYRSYLDQQVHEEMHPDQEWDELESQLAAAQKRERGIKRYLRDEVGYEFSDEELEQALAAASEASDEEE